MEGLIPGTIQSDTIVIGEGAAADRHVADGIDCRADQTVVISMGIENRDIPAARHEQTGIVDEARRFRRVGVEIAVRNVDVSRGGQHGAPQEIIVCHHVIEIDDILRDNR